MTLPTRPEYRFSSLLYLALAGALFLIWLIFVTLFTPALAYRLRAPIPLDSDEFLYFLESSSPSRVYSHNSVQVFTEGEAFYQAMVAAIEQATRSVNLECYIFDPGTVADRFVRALVDRAMAGVPVTIVLDAIGSLTVGRNQLAPLKKAGCRVEFYQGPKWYSLARLNNRTHRELLVVDGRIAFLGGAGIADYWAVASDRRTPWRDTVIQIEGPAVAAVQGVFAENWLECCGEILTGGEYYPPLSPAGSVRAIVIKSSPADRATVSRVLFQALIEGTAESVALCTPYFLPDRMLRRALIDAASRGVRVLVLTPGSHTDQRWVRIASRRSFGELLSRGVRIFEYEHAMLHQKLLIADELWSVLGTTNIDNRSFEHNDEVNIAFPDRALSEKLTEVYRQDLALSREVTLEQWRRRPLWEKAIGQVAWILERQQ